MAEQRTRPHESPRRRKRNTIKPIIDQEEDPRTRAPYQLAGITSSYSSSSSYIDISRTYPPSRLRGLGFIRAFFSSPSEHRRRPRRRTSRPYLRGEVSSSSSVNTDLAYGTGYIRRRKGDMRKGKGKERELADRRDPRAEKDPDAAILEVGAGLAALARKQNRLDMTEARRQGIAPPRRSDSELLKAGESTRGLGSSKISHDPDEEGWESATDADSETSSVDSRLAYRHDNGPGWGGFFRSRPRPRRKESVVDPALFGPANSLHGIVQEPMGFDDVDHDNLSDYPPPTVATLQKQGQLSQTFMPERDQGIPSASASATGPLQYVYPVPTSDPTRFDTLRGSVVSTKESSGARPAPVHLQQVAVEIQQPQPKPVVSQSVFEPSYSTRPEPKIPSSSGRTKSYVAEAALAGIAGAVLGAVTSSDRRDERKDNEKRENKRDSYDGDRRKYEARDRPETNEGIEDRREKRRERDPGEPEENQEERRERRRREKREDPDYEPREKRRERRRDEEAPNDRVDSRREEKYRERVNDRDDERRNRRDAPVVPPIDPFQYQVADDAFKTPDGTRNSEPFSSIQRARSPAVVTVERVPHWHRDAPTKEEIVNPADADQEKDQDARDRKETEEEAKTLFEEMEHSTIPVEASAVSAAIAAEEHRYSREKVRKRRYDRSGDASPTGDRDPIQADADRIYREAILARKIAASKNEDPIPRIVTPPEMAHKNTQEVLYPVPNADFELDHVMDPLEFMASPIKGHGEGFDRIKPLSGVASEDLKRPLLTLVRPTPTPSPAPPEQISEPEKKDSQRETESSESRRSQSRRNESSRDAESSKQGGNRPGRERVQNSESSEPREELIGDTTGTEAKGNRTQTPISANGSKGVTWGENDTKHFEVETPYETKDDPISASVRASEKQEKPKMSKERKASAWGALRGAFMSGAAAEVVAKAAEGSIDKKDTDQDRTDKNIKPDRTDHKETLEKKIPSTTSQFEYRGVVVEPEHSDSETREQPPPAVGPKPSSNMPGAFDDDLDFTATLAAGLQDSGFDPNIVIKNPTYRRRSSPPGSEDSPLADYKQAYAETVSDLGQYANPNIETSRDIKTQNSDFKNDYYDIVQKKDDRNSDRQSGEIRDSDLASTTPVSTQLADEPESFLESSKSSKKDRKRDKTRKSKDTNDDADDRISKRVSVPVDAFDDLHGEAVQVEAAEDWDAPKKSKKKSKRDSDRFDPSSRSMSADDIAPSTESSKSKSREKSLKRSSQYDSEPNPEDVPLPSASEISREDDYDFRKSKKSSKRSGSIPDNVDRESQSVKSDTSRYVDEDDSRSTKKEKKSSGFFGGIFGSTTSKSEPEREEPESKKKSKKSKRSSTEDGSEPYGSDVKSDVKSSLNGNGFNNYDDDEDDPKRPINGDSKHEKTDEKKDSFLGNADTLGAGVGLAAAIALAAQHQQPEAATTHTDEQVPRGSTPEHTSPISASVDEVSRAVIEEPVIDPEIIERQIRPSIDPQYGDLLPLPPSDPGSPNIEAEDELPSLPESRPNTPPKTESVPTHDRSVGLNRRSELAPLVKTPSQSAVPLKFILGNRSTPLSPGLVRAPSSMVSPSTMSPESLGLHRPRSRPTSWDSSKEIKPLLLLDPSRHATSQSTDSEVQSPEADYVTKTTRFNDLMQEPEPLPEKLHFDVRDDEEGPKVDHHIVHVEGDQPKNVTPAMGFPDPTNLPRLPKSREPTPMGRDAPELDLSSLPPLPKSRTATPVESDNESVVPQHQDKRSLKPVQDKSLYSSDLATAGLITGAGLDLSAGVLAFVSSLGELAQTKESSPEPAVAQELPEEFQVEPITKDRSSYLFQATPPAKLSRYQDLDTTLETKKSKVTTPSRIDEVTFPVDGKIGSIDGSPTRIVTNNREATLEALTRPVPDGEKSIDTMMSTRLTTAIESGVNATDGLSFTGSSKNKKKGKNNKAGPFVLEDEPSSSTITPPITTESKNVEVPAEFLLKKSKKDKKKDKKRVSSQWDVEDEPTKSAILAPADQAGAQKRDITDEPSQPSTIVLSPIEEPVLEIAESVEEFPLKESKKDKRKGKKGGFRLTERETEGIESTTLMPIVASDEKETDPITDPKDEPSGSVPGTVVQSQVESSQKIDSLELPKDLNRIQPVRNPNMVNPTNDFDTVEQPREYESVQSGKGVDTLDQARALDRIGVNKDYGTVEPSNDLDTGEAAKDLETTEPIKDLDTVEAYPLEESEEDKDKEVDQGKAVDTVGYTDEISADAVILPPSVSSLEEAEPVYVPSESLSGNIVPSSVQLADDVDKPQEFTLKKSKKDKDRKKSLELNEDVGDVSPISAIPSSVIIDAQEADPSDEYSSTTSKKDKKKGKKNRKNLSRSSTAAETSVYEPVEITDAEGVGLPAAEQTPLPLSSTHSEIGDAFNVSEAYATTRDTEPNQDMSLQPPEQFTEPTFVKSFEKDEKDDYDSLSSPGRDELLESSVVANEVNIKTPIEHQADELGLQSRENIDVQTEPPEEPQKETVLLQESKKDKKDKKKGNKSLRDWESEDSLASVPVMEGQANENHAQNESAEDQQVRSTVIETEPDRRMSVLENRIEKGVVERDEPRKICTPELPSDKELQDYNSIVEDSRPNDVPLAKEDDHSKPIESLTQLQSTKDSKKSKKKNGKSFLPWQDDDAGESKLNVDPVSEPSTAAPSDGEDLSGFLIKKSKAKGKKKQNRKSIAWDVQKPEAEIAPEAVQSTMTSDSTIHDFPIETNLSNETADQTHQHVTVPATISDDHQVEEEPSHVCEPDSRRDVAPYEADAATEEIKKSLPYTGSPATLKSPIEPELPDTARGNFSGVNYFPSAAVLHSLPVQTEVEESIQSSYFPSATRLLPIATSLMAAAASSKVLEPDSVEQVLPGNASASTAITVRRPVVEPLDDDAHNEYTPMEEPPRQSRKEPAADDQPPALNETRSLPEPAVPDVLPEQTHTGDFLPTISPHSTSPARSSDVGRSKGYLPSGTALFPLVGVAALMNEERHHKQEPTARDISNNEPPTAHIVAYDEQPLPAAYHMDAETNILVSEKDDPTIASQAPEEQVTDTKSLSLNSEEQVDEACQFNAGLSSGRKKSKKSKNNRADLSRVSTQDDDLPTEVADEPKELQQRSELTRKTSAGNEPQIADGLAAGYGEDQVALAKQLQAEYESGSKKSKKGKKSRSTSRTSRAHDFDPSFSEEPEASPIQPGEELSREIEPEVEDTAKNPGPDGLTAGPTEEQLETARQMKEAFASGSKKSKKEKKRKGLTRSVTDENMSDPAAEDIPEETSLATTEVDSATNSPYPLSNVPTLDGFDPQLSTKKGKKEKKRQSLLRSFTQDSEESTSLNREITAYSQPTELASSEKDIVEATNLTPELLVDPEEKSSSGFVEEPEISSFSTKKGKKGSKKRQSLQTTATQEEAPFQDQNFAAIEPVLAEKEVTEATTSQPLDLIADDGMDALADELNFGLKKSKHDKTGIKNKQKDVDNEFIETDGVAQPMELHIFTERDVVAGKAHDHVSLADRIWADVVPVSNNSSQAEAENPSTESEDPLDLFTSKKSKKSKKENQAIAASVPESKPFLTSRDIEAPSISTEQEIKEQAISREDEMPVGTNEHKQPALFETWNFENLPLEDTAAQEAFAHETQTTSNYVEVAHDARQAMAPEINPALPALKNYVSTHLVQEQKEHPIIVESITGLETPPPVMPKNLAWEDEPALQEETDRAIDTADSLAPHSKGHNDSESKDKARSSLAKPISASILAAGTTLFAGAAMGYNKESAEAEPLSIDVSRMAIDNNHETNTSPPPIESEKKREKRPAKSLDKSRPKEDLFDHPMLWESAKPQTLGDLSGDGAELWSEPTSRDDSTKDKLAVSELENGPSSIPHKREISESLMGVRETSTVLDHIKTPRKNRNEDISAATARDAAIEREIAHGQPIDDDSLCRESLEEDDVSTEKPKPIVRGFDVPEDILSQTPKKSKKGKKDKKRNDWIVWGASEEVNEADVESSETRDLEHATSRGFDTTLNEDERALIDHEATEDHKRQLLEKQEAGIASSSVLPLIGEEETFTQRSRDDSGGHERIAKGRHRGEETYLPPPSNLPRVTEDESTVQRNLDTTPVEAYSENRAKDKNKRQELYLPHGPTLPIVIEEEDHNADPEKTIHERAMNDSNRDSAFVAGSPVPVQRSVAQDHEYARDSGVHLGDTPITKEKSHIGSADDALARMSWPAVDEETETVDLKRSQRPKGDHALKGQAADPAAAVAVTELAHLAARSPPQKRDEQGETAKFDRSITPNMARLQTPEHFKHRSGSVGSNLSSGTPPLRRSDRKLSGDLRSLSQRSQANLAKEAKDAREAEPSPTTSVISINPIANESRPRAKDMTDVYDGYGEGRIGSPMSPTRPHSMRRRQSMQVLDLEARIERLAAENRQLAEAKEMAEHNLHSSQRATFALAGRDAELDSLKQKLDWLQREVERLKEVNDGLTSANVTLGRQHNERYGTLESKHADATRELEDMRQERGGPSRDTEDDIEERVAAATSHKDREIEKLNQDLDAAHERIRDMQREILRIKDSDTEFLVVRDEDYFDNACQQLCQHVQQWVLRFSKFSDMRACRRTNEINNDKIIDRLDNAVLDGSDLDEYLSNRVQRRDIFMSMTMTMIWEFVFTRYLFGMDREQRQKLKSLEKTLLEVGPLAAVHQWRATTLTLLSRREAFQQQREEDTLAVVQMIFQTLSEILPPPSQMEEQIQEQLMRVMKAAVDLSIEMRTQRAEYMMLPPLQPEYDANGDLARQVQFNAALMNERSGDTVSNEELEAQHAVVRIVLFPLVVKKGDDIGDGDDEIVVCPAQVLVAKSKTHSRGLTPEVMGQNHNHSRTSMHSGMPTEQQVPDI